MPRLSQAEIRNNAIAFAHDWKDETSERAESQTFWNEFFQVFGLRRRDVAVFEKAVQRPQGKFGKIDVFWKGIVLAEHKSAGENLDKATSQAFEYVEGLPESERPQFVLISDFQRFRLFDLDAGAEYSFALSELPDKIGLFSFISGYQKREFREQDPVNIKAAQKLGALHDALDESGYRGHPLEVFLVRLVYCLFADDTGIFQPRESFLRFLKEKTTADNCGAMLGLLFQVLDTPDEERAATLDEDLLGFQYVNGALFRERFDMPFFNAKMRQLLIEACEMDWGKVSPAIFGSLFQSVMDKDERRHLGAHYTSEKNILKVVHGLFLDDLQAEFESVKNNLTRLKQFHDKIARLRFFDPACGCGNFLVITYREMRRLELTVLKQIRLLTGDTRGLLMATKLSRLSVDQYYGIEIEEFPAEIARVALWVTDHLANIELSQEFGISQFELPLEHTPNIVHGNALRLDWAEVLSPKVTNTIASGETRRTDAPDGSVPEGDTPDAAGATPSGSEWVVDADVGLHPTLLKLSPSGTGADEDLFILGNPPFVGKQFRNDAQNADMAHVFANVPNSGVLDYVCAWYVKAAEFGADQTGGVAFVSTNSITQGEQVGILWGYLLSRGVRIRFAHRTFKWSNEAPGRAAVYCVIIGFGGPAPRVRRLFDYETPISEPHVIEAKNISPYLIDADDVVIRNRTRSICDVPEIVFGNMPNDGGHLLLSPSERRELLRREPDAERFIRPFVGSQEFINGESRYCIWLKEVPPNEWRGMTAIVERVNAVRQHRSASTRATTRRLSDTPYLFGEIRQEFGEYILIPSVSSENRRFVPIGFMPSDVIASNLVLFVPGGNKYHFGVLTSTMHNAWMRQVCGRLKSDYRYSNKLVYNNFPWPKAPTDEQRARIERTAQAILDARAKYPGSTMAALYDPLTMPPELVAAHRDNDTAVDAAYGKRGFANELERLEFLFGLYREYTEPLRLEEQGKAKRKRRKA